MKLKVNTREKLGRQAKKLRREGIVPAELFGRGFDNIHIAVDEKEFIKLYREAGQNTIIDLEVEGEDKNIPALIYDVQIHPIKRKPLAIDFYRIREDEKIETQIPIEYIGEAPIEKEDFIVVKVLDEIKIESLPREIPQKITVDLSGLEDENDIIHVKDLDIPEGVDLQTDLDRVVVSITEKEEEEEEEIAPIMPGELGELGEDMEGEMPLGEEGEMPEESPLEEGEEPQGEEPEL